ncbi:MAG TPA: PaaI family thioesterase [Burkholderiales bacterium]|nr:PaaI family thioesterase [Burkholderiales bacterium]
MNAPPKFQPQDPGFAVRIRASFARQKAMDLIGARLTVVEPGYTEIALGYRPELTQQRAYLHGGILGMIADSACGYAAYSLMPASASLVTVEYKINILAPAKGDVVARGQVIRPGRSLTVTRGEVFAADGTHVASMQQTLMMLPDTPDTAG